MQSGELLKKKGCVKEYKEDITLEKMNQKSLY